jgi:ribonucleoside-diphosphate reductase beta chain
MLAGYDHLLAAARRLQWDAEAIDLAADRTAADRLPAGDRAALDQLIAGFLVAESAVAAELDPWIAAADEPIARECFAAQQRDELRHARFFQRVATEVLGLDPATAYEAAPATIRELFRRTLPATARSLAADAGTMAGAVGLYHLVLEGIVFAVGQESLLELASAHALDGVAAGVARVQADERWHVGLGVLHLQRLGAPVNVDEGVREALTAWGPAIATPQRTARVLAAHARRVKIAGSAPAPSIESLP